MFYKSVPFKIKQKQKIHAFHFTGMRMSPLLESTNVHLCWWRANGFCFCSLIHCNMEKVSVSQHITFHYKKCFIHLVWHWVKTFCLNSLQVIAQLL